jgi:hypothetical protein
MATATLPKQLRVHVRGRIVCPHCWHNFAAEDILWVAEHEELRGDPVLGPDAHLRFLPSRFDIGGNAIDSRGMTCQSLACPNCHLQIPRVLVDIAPLFVSILGIPSCGKSYFLASMTWRLRQTLPKHFHIAFGDADPTSNIIINDYERQQFFSPDRLSAVKLAKTEEQGYWYDTVNYGDQTVSYPRPFLFSMFPLQGHPRFAHRGDVARCLCMYDNAGESFQPGKDTVASPVTRHLVKSQALFFLFDPTQDPRFQAACQGKTEDPQMLGNQSKSFRQDIVLHEAANRVRKYSGLKHDERHNRPLIVVVTKYDAWSSLLPEVRETQPWRSTADGMCALEWDKIKSVSDRLRHLLWELAPELVSSAEGFAQEVLYVPVSATGCSPVVDQAGAIQGVRPCDIQPCWIEVPLLAVLARWSKNLIPYVTSAKK